MSGSISIRRNENRLGAASARNAVGKSSHIRGKSLDFKQLRYFLTLADTGSFSKAAVMLGVGQPAVSRYIRTLEDELGIDLLYRNGRGIVLTEAGKILQHHAKAIVEHVSVA